MIFEQGSIVKVCLDPSKGHEEAGYRPVLVIQRTKLSALLKSTTVVLPITSSVKELPLELSLPEGLKTKGKVLCRHIRSLDLWARDSYFVEKVPDEFLKECVRIVNAIIYAD